MVTVWFTSNTRPKIIVKQMFDQSVVDIAWSVVLVVCSFSSYPFHTRSRDGLQLLMCSTDGTICFLRIAGNLRPLSASAAADYLRATYGDAVLRPNAASNAIIEDPALLALTANSQAASLQVPIHAICNRSCCC